MRLINVSCVDHRHREIAVLLRELLHALLSTISDRLLLLLSVLPGIQEIIFSLMMIARAPRLLLRDNIYIEDALGRSMVLSYSDFQYWEVLQARLQVAFTGVPGEFKVKTNQFELVDLRAGSNQVLNRNNWERLIAPGSRLAMSILLQHLSSHRGICPRCGLTMATAFADTWVQW